MSRHRHIEYTRHARRVPFVAAVAPRSGQLAPVAALVAAVAAFVCWEVAPLVTTALQGFEQIGRALH